VLAGLGVAERVGFTVREVVEVTPAEMQHLATIMVVVEADRSTSTKMEKQLSDVSNPENAK